MKRVVNCAGEICYFFNNMIDLTGKTFGRLTVLALAPKACSTDKLKWYCRCSCGVEKMIYGEALRTGNTRSCGCLAGEKGEKCAEAMSGFNFNLKRKVTFDEAFWMRVEKQEDPTQCWKWSGGKSKGYGTFQWRKRSFLAHRVSLSIKLGRAIKKGRLCCHHCDNPECTNPDHLYEGTFKTNWSDCRARNRANPVFGERLWNAKLKPDDVRFIRAVRARYGKGGISDKKLSSMLCVSPTAIRRASLRMTWKSVTDDEIDKIRDAYMKSLP